MSYMCINITDKKCTISGEVHGATAERIIAALSAEPETIAELNKALRRFEWRKNLNDSPFGWFSKNENLEPADAGIIAVDLAGRTIGHESSYFLPAKEGAVYYHDGQCQTDIPERYRLPEDWLIVDSIEEYRAIAPQRRAERAKIKPLNARKVLFGKPLFDFLAEKIPGADLQNEELFADIHAAWLMTARKDLGGKTPREILFEKRDFLSRDLQYREEHWSFTGLCPPTLPKNSPAFIYAGFGTHEIVVYYDLVRHLLEECVEKLQNSDNFSKTDLSRFLEKSKNAWLQSPHKDFMNRAPAEIIESERCRLPLAMTAHEILIDDDCPVCVAMAEDFETPMFWHLDGCNMDWRFEFSFEKTREDWEERQRRYEEFNREFAEGEWREDKSDTDDWSVLDEDLIE